VDSGYWNLMNESATDIFITQWNGIISNLVNFRAADDSLEYDGALILLLTLWLGVLSKEDREIAEALVTLASRAALVEQRDKAQARWS